MRRRKDFHIGQNVVKVLVSMGFKGTEVNNKGHFSSPQLELILFKNEAASCNVGPKWVQIRFQGCSNCWIPREDGDIRRSVEGYA